VDQTRLKFFSSSISIFIWLIVIGSIIWLIPPLKALAVSFFAGAGILMVFVGLAAQEAFSNIVGGIFIIIFRPFRVGDLIKVGNLDHGIVRYITLRHTVIRNFENNHIFIPNSIISSDTVINNSIEDPAVCRLLEIGISYDSDLDLAIRIIQEEAQSHPNTIDRRTPEQISNNDHPVRVRLVGYGDFSINLIAYVWVDNFLNGRNVQSDLLMAIKKRFDKEGVEIPFPYRTVVYKKDLPPNASMQ
jgi:small-conductance mechanosensitive channel